MTTTREYPKLERQPLTLVVAEFRFSRLNLDSEEVMGFRHEVEARLESRAKLRTAQSTQVDADGIFVSANPILRWTSEKLGECVYLESDRLVFATTQYPRFPDFQRKIESLLEALEDACGIEKLYRVGLRYNDAVVPEANENLGAYLVPPLLPAADMPEALQTLRGHRTETEFVTEAGALIVRAFLGRHGWAFTPDLAARSGLASPIEVPDDRGTAVLDFDHYWLPLEPEGVLFDVESAISRFAALHEPAILAFWSFTTDYARKEVWR